MNAINIFNLLTLQVEPLINLSNLQTNLGNDENRTGGSWVRSINATCVLCRFDIFRSDEKWALFNFRVCKETYPGNLEPSLFRFPSDLSTLTNNNAQQGFFVQSLMGLVIIFLNCFALRGKLWGTSSVLVFFFLLKNAFVVIKKILTEWRPLPASVKEKQRMSSLLLFTQSHSVKSVNWSLPALDPEIVGISRYLNRSKPKWLRWAVWAGWTTF